MRQNIIAIIPARMGSSRFYGKPMQKINGIPMIERIYKILSKVKVLKMVVVATCDEEIFNHIKGISGNVVMTKKSHLRASDRCAEAIKIIEKKEKLFFDMVIMIQGDEPMVTESMINSSIKPMLNDRSIQISNLCTRIKNKKDFYDKNCVKVIFNNNMNAIYFSRSPIPFSNKKNFIGFKQVCVIPFRRKFLDWYNKISPTFLEEIESIDMNRLIENDIKIKMIKIKKETFPVDTIKDLKRVKKLIKSGL